MAGTVRRIANILGAFVAIVFALDAFANRRVSAHAGDTQTGGPVEIAVGSVVHRRVATGSAHRAACIVGAFIVVVAGFRALALRRLIAAPSQRDHCERASAHEYV
jgi:hypothetical protein